MSAEKKDCLSMMKGQYPDSRREFSDFNTEIHTTQAYKGLFNVKTLAIQNIQSEN